MRKVGNPVATGLDFRAGTRADGLPAALSDPARLAAVAGTGLLDTGPEEVFEDLASLAARVTGSGRAFVTLVDEDRSFWKSCVGVDATAITARQNPVRESFCYFLVGLAGDPFIVDDAASDPGPATTLRSGRCTSAPGQAFRCWRPAARCWGASASSTTPLTWSAADLTTLETLARSVSAEIHLRQSLEAARQAHRLSADLAHSLQQGLLRRPSTPSPAWRWPPPTIRHRPAAVPGSRWAATSTTCSPPGGLVRRRTRRCVRQGRGSRQGHRHGALHRAGRRLAGPLTGSPAGRAEHRDARPARAPVPDGRLHRLPPHPGRTRGPRQPRRAPARPHPPGRRTRAAGRHPGTLLGVVEHVRLVDVRFRLGPGDLLLLYTDGACEARLAPAHRPASGSRCSATPSSPPHCPARAVWTRKRP